MPPVTVCLYYTEYCVGGLSKLKLPQKSEAQWGGDAAHCPSQRLGGPPRKFPPQKTRSNALHIRQPLPNLCFLSVHPPVGFLAGFTPLWYSLDDQCTRGKTKERERDREVLFLSLSGKGPKPALCQPSTSLHSICLLILNPFFWSW